MIGHVINNYIIERKLGDGGMGVVYYAKHNRVDREVAIKVLHSNLFSNESIRNRFKNEANALIKLTNPNIVKIIDYVEQDNMACLIMEYIDGYTLDEYINKVSGPLPSPKAISIIGSVLSAVQYAHDNNIFHRDIKPGNIMVNRDGSEVKIMDFGIAKITDAANWKTTHAQAQLGTPFYMSPEQVKGLPYNSLSDIYSLGVTLFEMVTGKCPYQEITNLFELQTKIVSEPLPPTSNYYPSVTNIIQQAIIIATNKEPQKRFQTCTEFKKYLLNDEKQVQILNPKFEKVNLLPKTPLPPTVLKKNNSIKLIFLIVILVLIFVAIGVLLFFYRNLTIETSNVPKSEVTLPALLDTSKSNSSTKDTLISTRDTTPPIPKSDLLNKKSEPTATPPKPPLTLEFIEKDFRIRKIIGEDEKLIPEQKLTYNKNLNFTTENGALIKNAIYNEDNILIKTPTIK